MLFLLTAASALIPSLLLLWYFHAKDVHREPGEVIWATFGLGVAIIAPVLLVDGLIYLLLPDFSSMPYAKGASDAFLMAAIPEEFFKFTVLWLYVLRHKEFDEPMDGIVYGVVASLGFATLENIIYTADGGLGVAILRALTAVPLHAFLGAIMGYYVGQMRFGKPEMRSKNLWMALSMPMLLHGLYDFPILTIKQMQENLGTAGPVGEGLGLVGITLIVLIFTWVWAIKLTNRLRRQQDAEQKTTQQQALLAAADPSLPAPLAKPPVSRPAQKTGGGFFAWCGLIIGGILASLGGLVVLGLILGLAFGKNEGTEIGPLILGGGLIGVLPLGLGLWFFILGLRSVRRKSAASITR
ncbi:MAG: PrsW family intramembrane metalloprotease [Deltaproteobacteria bacterium]|nr:PrsW family intramembrane metalloprotease [Deltaproteobacteria bacterium]